MNQACIRKERKSGRLKTKWSRTAMAVIRTERSRHSMLRKMGLNRERLLLAYFLQGAKRNKSLIREFAEVWSFPVCNVWGAVYQLQMLAIPSWLHDGLFLALQELLEMLHTLSGKWFKVRLPTVLVSYQVAWFSNKVFAQVFQRLWVQILSKG